jgi:hypothetical protein
MAAIGYVDSDGCHLWAGSLTKAGYGIVSHRQVNRYAHRVAWELLHGPIPDGLSIDHLCRVRSCINPAHMEPVSPAENCRRGAKAKITATDAAAIRASNERPIDLARRYGIAAATVTNIRAGRRWKVST